MSDMQAFFAQSVAPIKETEVVVSERFKDKNGDVAKWKISPVSTETDTRLRETCTETHQVPGKRSKYKRELNVNRYLAALAVTCTKYPNLNDAELQASYGVNGAETLIRTMLLPGEYYDFIAKLQEINGFDINMDDLIDEAKN